MTFSRLCIRKMPHQQSPASPDEGNPEDAAICGSGVWRESDWNCQLKGSTRRFRTIFSPILSPITLKWPIQKIHCWFNFVEGFTQPILQKMNQLLWLLTDGIRDPLTCMFRHSRGRKWTRGWWEWLDEMEPRTCSPQSRSLSSYKERGHTPSCLPRRPN